MSNLTVTKKQEGDILNAVLEGRLDSSTASKLDEEIRPELDNIRKLVMNFEKIKYISSTGIRVLLSFHKKLTANGGELIISKPTEMVLEVFDLTGFTDVFNIEDFVN